MRVDLVPLAHASHLSVVGWGNGIPNRTSMFGDQTGRLLGRDATRFSNKGDHVATLAMAETIEAALTHGDDKCPVATLIADGTGTAPLVAMLAQFQVQQAEHTVNRNLLF